MKQVFFKQCLVTSPFLREIYSWRPVMVLVAFWAASSILPIVGVLRWNLGLFFLFSVSLADARCFTYFSFYDMRFADCILKAEQLCACLGIYLAILLFFISKGKQLEYLVLLPNGWTYHTDSNLLYEKRIPKFH